MSDNPADAITDRLIERMREPMDAIGAELESRWREMVSVPVGVSGKTIIRSLPGEPPRTEHGDYLESTSHRTEVEGDVVRTEAGTPMQRGVYLQKGTSRMKPRPHASKLAEQFAGEVVEKVGNAVSEAAKQP